jgi:hypothetical protein
MISTIVVGHKKHIAEFVEKAEKEWHEIKVLGTPAVSRARDTDGWRLKASEALAKHGDRVSDMSLMLR